jgi:glycosyltransferase involved in cell wall biosynthesis
MTGLAFTKEEFIPSWYLSTYADVRSAGIDPWEHYLENGHKEGRFGCPVRALELDHKLWRGFEAQALTELRLLVKCGSARERAVAGWVIARHAASKGRWKTAYSAISAFFDGGELGTAIIAHKGPWILGAKAASACHDPSAARSILQKAEKRFGRDADFALSRIDLALAEGASDEDLSADLADLHSATDLVRIGLTSGTRPRFDRLVPLTTPTPITNGPLVSVIVPAYRAEATLDTCLRGLTAQSWRNLEIIVVDDASPDNTIEVAERAAKADPRIRIVRHRENSGAYVARNTGLSEVRGDFFTVHDSDDWSHPQKIEQQVMPLLDDDTRVACASHWVRTGPDLSMTLWRIEEAWVYRNVSSLMIRTETRESLGYWDRVRANADTEYYHRLIAAFGQKALIERHNGVPLAFGRNAPESLTLSSATHLSTQFRGPRRAYLDAALHWHDTKLSAVDSAAGGNARAAALHLPRHPRERPFPAPSALQPCENTTAETDYSIIARSPRFDALWYLARNKDVLTADVDPVRHYLETGGRESRDPGPMFSDSAWRKLRKLDDNAIPLLDCERTPDADLTEAFRFDGALSAEGHPNALVFAHSADRHIFGAERSLLKALDHLAEGVDGTPIVPITVLPSAANEGYLSEIRARSAAVEILPQLWRHRLHGTSEDTVNAIRGMIRRYQPVEVHVNTLVLDAPLAAARAEGCPSIVHVRELPDQDPYLCQILGDSARGLRRRLLDEADRFVANSPAVVDWIDAPGRVTLRINEIDPDLFNLPYAPETNLRVALISSNIAKKGIKDFVNIARLVAEAEADQHVPPDARCRFLLIGPASADLLSLGALPSNVEITGYLEGPVAAIERADLVLILSNFAESFGRTALEAMAAGRPVICYDRGTPPRLIIPGKTGFAVPSGDLNAATRAVLAVSVSRLSLQGMSKAARKRAKDLSRSGSQAIQYLS